MSIFMIALIASLSSFSFLSASTKLNNFNISRLNTRFDDIVSSGTTINISFFTTLFNEISAFTVPRIINLELFILLNLLT